MHVSCKGSNNRSDSIPQLPDPNVHELNLGNILSFPGGLVVKNPPAMQETWERWVRSLGQEDPLEEEMATHSSTLAWKIPWTEEAGGLQSMGLQRVRHD